LGILDDLLGNWVTSMGYVEVSSLKLFGKVRVRIYKQLARTRKVIMVCTFASKKLAYAALPTRGVPKVTPKTSMFEGRFKRRNMASNSAIAAPNECPV
jgi:hypothetical protein